MISHTPRHLRAYLAALPTNSPQFYPIQFDLGKVGKGVLVCCMASFCERFIVQTAFFFCQLLFNRQQRFNPETRAFLRLIVWLVKGICLPENHKQTRNCAGADGEKIMTWQQEQCRLTATAAGHLCVGVYFCWWDRLFLLVVEHERQRVHLLENVIDIKNCFVSLLCWTCWRRGPGRAFRKLLCSPKQNELQLNVLDQQCLRKRLRIFEAVVWKWSAELFSVLETAESN